MKTKSPIKDAWLAALEWPGKFYAAKKARPTSKKIEGGCLGFMLVGFAFIILPLTIMLAVEAALIVWAIVVTVVCGVPQLVVKIKQNGANHA